MVKFYYIYQNFSFILADVFLQFVFLLQFRGLMKY